MPHASVFNTPSFGTATTSSCAAKFRQAHCLVLIVRPNASNDFIKDSFWPKECDQICMPSEVNLMLSQRCRTIQMTAIQSHPKGLTGLALTTLGFKVCCTEVQDTNEICL